MLKGQKSKLPKITILSSFIGQIYLKYLQDPIIFLRKKKRRKIYFLFWWNFKPKFSNFFTIQEISWENHFSDCRLWLLNLFWILEKGIFLSLLQKRGSVRPFLKDIWHCLKFWKKIKKPWLRFLANWVFKEMKDSFFIDKKNFLIFCKLLRKNFFLYHPKSLIVLMMKNIEENSKKTFW